MAQPKTFTGSKILIMVGDGATPEVFAHPCLINASRSFQLSATTVDSVVPDCDDMEAPAWTEREKDAISATVTGEGVMDADSLEEYLTWVTEAASRNCKIVIADGQAAGQTLTGKFHLTEFQNSGDRKAKTESSITLMSDGPLVISANA